ncbi:hypothetical protein [Variovorax paradoxus]|nr:hypothetical protein [Variovorax paradoxus]
MRSQCLLVMPDLELDAPMFLTPRVVITNMDVAHIRASLARMARR